MNNLKKVFGLIETLDKSFSDIEYKDFDKVLIDEKIKELYSDFAEFEQRNLNRSDILKDEMILVKAKEKAYLNAKLEISREYYPVELFFKKQCEIEKGIDPTFDIEVFAECEKDRIESILEQVKQLSDKSYYSETGTYKQALKYIKYLSEIIKGKAKKKLSKIIKSFAAYIEHDKPETLAEALKTAFRDQKGKTIRLMIESLKIVDRLKICNDSELFHAIESSFDWNIGSYVGIFQTYKFDSTKKKYHKDLEPILKRVKILLSELEINKSITNDL